MGSVVEFPDRRPVDLDKVALHTADTLYVVGLDHNFVPVVDDEDASWWGTVGVWQGAGDTLNVRLSAAFLDIEHVKLFTKDMASTSGQEVIFGMDEEMIESIQDAMVQSVLNRTSDLELNDE